MSWTREQICQRAAREIAPGAYVNLGIGMPTGVAAFIAPGQDITIHSENGLLGMGPHATPAQADKDLTNAGKQPVTALPGCSFFDSAMSFAMIRGRHIDVAILGGLQVSARGDLANWRVPGGMVKGMGGAMDLVTGARHVMVLMEHTTREGHPRLLTECTYPLTGSGVVDQIITTLGVFAVTPQGLELSECAPGATPDFIAAHTQASFTINLRGNRT